jgi:hypothetical protein
MVLLLFLITRPKLLESLLALFANPLASTSALKEEDEVQILDFQEESGYQTNYSRLATVGSGKKNYTASVQDPKLFLASSLGNVSRLYPGKVEAMIQQQLSAEASAQLNLLVSPNAQ